MLLVSGEDDQISGRPRLSDMVVERLRANRHPFAYDHLCYIGAGYMILPSGLGRFSTPPFLEMGGTSEADHRATQDSGKKVLAFLDGHLT